MARGDRVDGAAGTERTARSWARRSLPAALLLGAAVVPLPAPAAASCAGPSIVEPREVLRPGAAVTVRGDAFADGCQDTASCSPVPGCGCRYDEPPPTPLTDVPLVLRQSGAEWPLGTADAGTAAEGALGEVAWEVVLPADARPGEATLVAGEDGFEAELRVRLR